MSAWVLLVAVSTLILLVLGVLGVGILIGVMVKGGRRRNLSDFQIQQKDGINLEPGVSQDQDKDRKSRLTIGCLLAIILILVCVLAALVLAGIWFVQLMKALSQGHPG